MDSDDQISNEEKLSDGEEDTVDERKHNKLLDAISSLDGKKRSKHSQRTVLSNQISEFNFTSSKDESSRVNLHELVGSLKESTSHGELKKQLRDIERKNETVSTPLPKHEKDKLARATAYESTAQDISKWDHIVHKNRKTDQLEFPLKKQDFRVITTDQLVKRFQPRTPLELEVATLLNGSDNVLHGKHQELTVAEQRALKAMDLDEAKLRRMELMKHRALLSYKEAKAKRQKKIKSKKYHRILKKERAKVEKKMMDKMKDEDPEGFLDKLNQLDKERAAERMSLKHRGASKFGKRQMIYAKYDDRARQEVQDMLRKSRELTKKVELDSDSENEELYPDTGIADDIDEEVDKYTTVKISDNPWMAKPSRSTLDVTSAKVVEKSTTLEFSRPEELKNEDIEEDKLGDCSDDDSGDDESGDVDVSKSNDDASENKKVEVHDLSSVTKDSSNSFKGRSGVNVLAINDVIDNIFKNTKSKRKRQHGESGQLEGKKVKMRHRKMKNIEKKVEEKKKNVVKKDGQKTKEPQGKKKRNTENAVKSGRDSDNEKDAESADDTNVAEDKVDDDSEDEIIISESLKRKKTLEDLENESDEDMGVVPTKKQRAKSKRKKKRVDEDSEEVTNNEEEFVDPKKLFTLETKLKQIGSGPDIIGDDEDDVDADEQQRMTIAQAFAEDDVIEEFTKQKKEVVERGKPKDIDLTLPGWGSWGGEGIKVSKMKKRRFRIKAPPALPRKDVNLGHVIINESKNEAVAKHQVHEIPFPYVNASQFETSIRAPLGKTWNPETVHKDLTKPRVVTQLGKIIEPIDKSEVFKDKKKVRGIDSGAETKLASNKHDNKKGKKFNDRRGKSFKIHKDGNKKFKKHGGKK